MIVRVVRPVQSTAGNMVGTERGTRSSSRTLRLSISQSGLKQGTGERSLRFGKPELGEGLFSLVALGGGWSVLEGVSSFSVGAGDLGATLVKLSNAFDSPAGGAIATSSRTSDGCCRAKIPRIPLALGQLDVPSESFPQSSQGFMWAFSAMPIRSSVKRRRDRSMRIASSSTYAGSSMSRTATLLSGGNTDNEGCSTCLYFWKSLVAAADELRKAFSELSCQRTQIRSKRQSYPGRSASDASASQISRTTPVGMSQTKASRFTIRATAKATSVPSILPTSLVTEYSCTQFSGPFPIENVRVNWA